MTKSLILFLYVSLIFQFLSATFYECDKEDVKDSICGTPTENGVKIKICPGNQFCDTNSLKCQSYDMPHNYSGSACTEDNQCKGGLKCEEKKCKGSADGEKCSSDEDCLLTSYCEGKICTALTDYNKECTQSEECKLFSDCVFIDNEKIVRKCIKFNSLPAGSWAAEDKFCQSYKRNTDSICVDQIYSTPDQKCTQNSDCQYQEFDGTKNVSKTGECKISGDNITRCYLAKDSQPLKTVKNFYAYFEEKFINKTPIHVALFRKENWFSFAKFNDTIKQILDGELAYLADCAYESIFGYKSNAGWIKSSIFTFFILLLAM